MNSSQIIKHQNKSTMKIENFLKDMYPKVSEALMPVWDIYPELKAEIMESYQSYASLSRFKIPSDDKLVEIAILYNDGRLNPHELTNMVAMSQFIINRLFENGDVMIPSSVESQI